jgi:single-stranded DNA-binding protein
MRSSSTIELIGYVYQDAKCPNESDYPNWVVFKMCVNKKYKTKEGEEKQDTSWYECKTNSEGMAKICKQYVKDKMGVLVRGIPKAKAYITKEGAAESSIEVLVTELNMITSPREQNITVENRVLSHLLPA